MSTFKKKIIISFEGGWVKVLCIFLNVDLNLSQFFLKCLLKIVFRCKHAKQTNNHN